MRTLGTIKNVRFYYSSGDAVVNYQYGRRTYANKNLPKKVLDFMLNCNCITTDRSKITGNLQSAYYENK